MSIRVSGGYSSFYSCFGLLPSDFFFIFLLLLVIGLSGIVIFHEVILLVLLSMELICLAVLLLLLSGSDIFVDSSGPLFVLIVLTVVAVESALALGIFVVYFRSVGGIEVDVIRSLKG